MMRLSAVSALVLLQPLHAHGHPWTASESCLVSTTAADRALLDTPGGVVFAPERGAIQSSPVSGEPDTQPVRLCN